MATSEDKIREALKKEAEEKTRDLDMKKGKEAIERKTPKPNGKGGKKG